MKTIWQYLPKLKVEILLDSVMPRLKAHPIGTFADELKDTDMG